MKLRMEHARSNSGTVPQTSERKHVTGNPSLSFLDSERLPSTSWERHYHISDSRKFPLDLSAWLADNSDDPAFVVKSPNPSIHLTKTNLFQHFIPQLKDHLLGRILGLEFDGGDREFTQGERNGIVFVGNRLYRHKVLRVNYTTYDNRREQDSINPRTHADVMVLSQEEQGTEGWHPYWYARVVGIFHTDVKYIGPASPGNQTRRFEFLWVRWFGTDPEYKSGWSAQRLHRIGFVPGDDPQAFGFLDPQCVIRGTHLIPSFHYGRTASLLPPSIARTPTDKDEDWVNYYVNMYVIYFTLN